MTDNLPPWGTFSDELASHQPIHSEFSKRQQDAMLKIAVIRAAFITEYRKASGDDVKDLELVEDRSDLTKVIMSVRRKEPQPDERDEIIRRLVEALAEIQFDTEDDYSLRTAKEVLSTLPEKYRSKP